MKPLRAPFPWFGGKSRVAPQVWERFGNVPNYVEPFAGSLAVLLGRPTPARVETVNDLDCYLANFWRAVQHAPEEVARFADAPVNEADLHARHTWLVARSEFRERMKTDPEFFDAKIAGWWVWGICSWIGSGWCARPDWNGRINAASWPRGINTAKHRVWQQLPASARTATGVARQIPNLSGNGGAAGRGIHASGKASSAITGWFEGLQARLRRVRVCCGDWQRILGPSPTDHIGLTGVLLDPPYGSTDQGRNTVYNEDCLEVAAKVRAWAIENGDNDQLRIALCGYSDEHQMPAGWTHLRWKANGGYGNNGQGRGRANAHKEIIWFSPHCLAPLRERDLFHASA